MKIIISNASDITFESKIDLHRLIPDGIDGTALQHDQGEGKVLISDSVWGIYCVNEEQFRLQYETGRSDFLTLLALSTRIVAKLKQEFNQDLVFEIQGLLDDQQ